MTGSSNPQTTARYQPGLAIRETAHQFALFALVGCAAAVGHYGVLIVLAEWFALPAVPASAAGFVVGAIISYALNYQFVFQSEKNHATTLARFLTIATIGLGLNSALMAALTAGLQFHYLMAQVAATASVMIWSYVGNRCWTFATKA
jgi:putative flippase GtrA